MEVSFKEGSSLQGGKTNRWEEKKENLPHPTRRKI